MKKQKAPIVPILIVIVLLGWIGYSSLPKGHATAPDQPKDDASVVGKDVASNMKTDAKADPKAKTDKPDKATPKPSALESSGPMRKVVTSSLLKIDPTAMKPKPNPSSTSSQWYEQDSAKIGG